MEGAFKVSRTLPVQLVPIQTKSTRLTRNYLYRKLRSNILSSSTRYTCYILGKSLNLKSNRVSKLNINPRDSTAGTAAFIWAQTRRRPIIISVPYQFQTFPLHYKLIYTHTHKLYIHSSSSSTSIFHQRPSCSFFPCLQLVIFFSHA